MSGSLAAVDDTCCVLQAADLCVSTGGGTVQSVTAGPGITIDNTDPTHPIINSAAGTVTSVTAGAGMTQTGVSTINPTLNVIANADGSIVVAADGISVGVITDTEHGTRGGGALHADSAAATPGFMSAADFNKLALYPTSPGTGALFFGLGVGGDFTAATSTLAADVYANNYTIPAAVTITTAGFGIYCAGTFTGAATGVIRSIGGNGGATATAGAATAIGSRSAASAAGGAGGIAGGSNGGSSSATIGGSGGAGGNGTSGNGGTGGTATAPTAVLGGFYSLTQATLAFMNALMGTNSAPTLGASGGGGGGDGTAGGGGGGAGGSVFIAARTMTFASGFTLSVAGGNGGTPGAGNRGGGGGGGGGMMRLYYYYLNDSGAVYNVSGGTKGLKSGTGTDGADGSPGTAILYPLL